MESLAVLYIRPMSRSLSHRPYLDKFGSVPILRWLNNRLLKHSRIEELTILHHHASEAGAIRDAVSDGRVDVRHTAHWCKLQAVSEAVAGTDTTRVVLLTLESCFAPCDVLARAERHHIDSRNTYTRVEGLPRGCDISIFDVKLLIALSRFAAPLGLTDPDDAVARLVVAAQTAGQHLPLPIRAVPFDAITACGLDPLRLPNAVSLGLESEVREAEQVILQLEAGGLSSLSSDVLYPLKQSATEKEVATRATSPFGGPLAKGGRASERIKVLYVSSASAFSGAEQSLCTSIKWVDQTRFEPFALVSREGVFAEKLRNAGVEVVCPEVNFAEATLANFKFTVSLLKQIGPHVLHLNGREGVPLLYGACSLGIPSVQHVRNVELAGFGEWLRSAVSVIAISEFVRREVLKFSIDPSKVTTLYNEVDPDEFRPGVFRKNDVRRDLAIPCDSKVVLMIARVDRYKRHDLMLNAAAVIRQQIPSFRLLIVGDSYGDSWEHDRILRQIQDMRLQAQVIWLDFVADIRRILAAADVLVLCSDREPLGRCVVEAMSMQVPVVVTDSGGTHEIVNSGVSGGFVVPAGDADALATRVCTLLLDDALRNELGRAGREYVRRDLNARVAASALMSIYEGVLSSGL